MVESQKTLVATREEVQALMKSNFKQSNPVLAFYSSHLDRIITDEDLMVIPIFDRQFHRAHAVFETVAIINNRLILLDEHLARMESGCKLVHIDLPMPLAAIREKVIDLAAFCLSFYKLENKNFSMRFWLSSGGEAFGIFPPGNSRFYAIALQFDRPSNAILYKDYTIENVDPKLGVLAVAKTTNYVVNTIVAIESKKKGGFIGIMTTKEGIILEGSIMNVGFIWKNGDFVTPCFERVLKGTTLAKSMNYMEQELVPKGIVKNVVQKDFTAKDVHENAVEMMFFGGNMVLPGGSLNDVEISKEIGPITKILQENVILKMAWSTGVPVPMDRY